MSIIEVSKGIVLFGTRLHRNIEIEIREDDDDIIILSANRHSRRVDVRYNPKILMALKRDEAMRLFLSLGDVLNVKKV